MTSAADILAAKDNILVQMLPLLILVAISVIASLAKRKQQQNAEQQRLPKREPDQPVQRAQAGPPPRPTAPAADRQTLVTAAFKSMGIETPQTPKAAPAKPKPPPVRRMPEPQAPQLGTDIQQHVREHLQMPEARQAKRPEARGTTVRLNARSARRAMIYHEIFSPPKALRTGGDMWDG